MNESEILFAERMKKICREVKFAELDEDRFEHWDVECDGVKYDVKAQKKLNHKDKEFSDVIWIELTNVQGKIGWIKGKADKIAFQYEDVFKIVDREKLFNFIVNFVPSTDVYRFKEYRRWYRRPGRLDVITYIYPADIEHLVETLL